MWHSTHTSSRVTVKLNQNPWTVHTIGGGWPGRLRHVGTELDGVKVAPGTVLGALYRSGQCQDRVPAFALDPGPRPQISPSLHRLLGASTYYMWGRRRPTPTTSGSEGTRARSGPAQTNCIEHTEQLRPSHRKRIRNNYARCHRKRIQNNYAQHHIDYNQNPLTHAETRRTQAQTRHSLRYRTPGRSPVLSDHGVPGVGPPKFRIGSARRSPLDPAIRRRRAPCGAKRRPRANR